jgi:hypothetical protein
MEEANAGRGMLSAVVVHKHGEYLPGPGFFKLAEELGIKNEADKLAFWNRQLHKVHDYWSVRRKPRA